MIYLWLGYSQTNVCIFKILKICRFMTQSLNLFCECKTCILLVPRITLLTILINFLINIKFCPYFSVCPAVGVWLDSMWNNCWNLSFFYSGNEKVLRKKEVRLVSHICCWPFHGKWVRFFYLSFSFTYIIRAIIRKISKSFFLTCNRNACFL